MISLIVSDKDERLYNKAVLNLIFPLRLMEVSKKMNYANEGPHEYRRTKVCVCVFMNACMCV